jgi:hypothetical protein
MAFSVVLVLEYDTGCAFIMNIVNRQEMVLYSVMVA